MYTLLRNSSLRNLLSVQAPPLLVSFVVASLYFKGWGFARECLAFSGALVRARCGLHLGPLAAVEALRDDLEPDAIGRSNRTPSLISHWPAHARATDRRASAHDGKHQREAGRRIERAGDGKADLLDQAPAANSPSGRP